MSRGILTRYYGPTDYRGSRIVAFADHPEGRLSIPYPHELDGSRAHAHAAEELQARLHWTGALFCCDVPGAVGSRGYVFALVTADEMRGALARLDAVEQAPADPGPCPRVIRTASIVGTTGGMIEAPCRYRAEHSGPCVPNV